MGTAIVSGLISSGKYSPEEISISNPHKEKIESFEAQGVNIHTSNKEAIKDASLIVLAVKPWIIPLVIEEIRSNISLTETEVCSLAAGITSEDLKRMFENYQPSTLTIAIPNTAMKVRESMTFIVPVSGHAEHSLSVFKELGKVMVVDEDHLGAGTALASCGIAFAMRYIRAACEGGVELGFKASAAKEIVCQTLQGTVTLLQEKDTHPETEIDKVTTPGGYTIKGLNAMERFGFTTSVIEGLKACKP